MPDFLTLVALLGSPASMVLTWFLTKRHFQKRDLALKDKDIEESTSDIISKNIKIYQDMLDDIEHRYEVKLKQRDEEINALHKVVKELKIEVEKLKKR